MIIKHLFDIDLSKGDVFYQLKDNFLIAGKSVYYVDSTAVFYIKDLPELETFDMYLNRIHDIYEGNYKTIFQHIFTPYSFRIDFDQRGLKNFQYFGKFRGKHSNSIYEVKLNLFYPYYFEAIRNFARVHQKLKNLKAADINAYNSIIETFNIYNYSPSYSLFFDPVNDSYVFKYKNVNIDDMKNPTVIWEFDLKTLSVKSIGYKEVVQSYNVNEIGQVLYKDGKYYAANIRFLPIVQSSLDTDRQFYINQIWSKKTDSLFNAIQNMARQESIDSDRYFTTYTPKLSSTIPNSLQHNYGVDNSLNPIDYLYNRLQILNSRIFSNLISLTKNNKLFSLHYAYCIHYQILQTNRNIHGSQSIHIKNFTDKQHIVWYTPIRGTQNDYNRNRDYMPIISQSGLIQYNDLDGEYYFIFPQYGAPGTGFNVNATYNDVRNGFVQAHQIIKLSDLSRTQYNSPLNYNPSSTAFYLCPGSHVDRQESSQNLTLDRAQYFPPYILFVEDYEADSTSVLLISRSYLMAHTSGYLNALKLSNEFLTILKQDKLNPTGQLKAVYHEERAVKIKPLKIYLVSDSLDNSTQKEFNSLPQGLFGVEKIINQDSTNETVSFIKGNKEQFIKYKQYGEYPEFQQKDEYNNEQVMTSVDNYIYRIYRIEKGSLGSLTTFDLTTPVDIYLTIIAPDNTTTIKNMKVGVYNDSIIYTIIIDDTPIDMNLYSSYADATTGLIPFTITLDAKVAGTNNPATVPRFTLKLIKHRDLLTNDINGIIRSKFRDSGSDTLTLTNFSSYNGIIDIDPTEDLGI